MPDRDVAEDAMKHGGGMTWQPITYDPELNLIYVTTGNPQPVIATRTGPGANLFTESIVALNPDTGKMVWYFQSSPHDTHDWDATQTAGPDRRRGQRPKAQAACPGVPERPLLPARSRERQDIVSSDYAKTNWAKGSTRRGSRFRIREEATNRRARSSRRNQADAANWPPPSSVLQPVCSTCRRRARSASSTFTIRARTRRGGAGPIAAVGRSRCCRRSTTRPARSVGAIAGTPPRARAC